MEPISVIVSVYNRLDYLQKALLSIQSQSIVPDQVVVSDDGSQEPIEDFLRNIAPRFSFSITLVRQEDRGFRLARCKNNGILFARNDYLVFWDQDVIGTKHYLRTFWENRHPKRFLVAYPVRLSEEQSQKITEKDIRAGHFAHLLTRKQIDKIHSQFRKDLFYKWYRRLIHRKDTRPKLRGGIFAVFKENLLRVNGFDEHYQGWGNEDDDLGRRLYASGVTGENPFYDEFPLHLYHPPHHQNGQRVNLDYYRQRQKEIQRGEVRAKIGLENRPQDEPIHVTEIS